MFMSKLSIGTDFFNIQCDGAENAPVLLISNSLGTNLSMWDAQIAALSAHFRVVRYDSRGHGHSIASQGPYSIAQLGQDALSILDALGIERAHFLGLSLGGMVGQWLLSHAPHRLERVVLANTAARMGPPQGWNARIKTVREKGMSAITSAVIERWFTPHFQTKKPDDVAKITNMLLTTPADGYIACCGAIRDMDQRESVRAASRPTLIITGNQDPATPPQLGHELASFIAGAKVKSLNAAHLSNVEAAQAFTKAVLDFLTAKETAKKAKKTIKKTAKKTAKKAPAKKAAKKTTKVKSTKKAARKTTPTKKIVKKSGTKKTAAKKPKTLPAQKSKIKKQAIKKTKPAKAKRTQKRKG